MLAGTPAVTRAATDCPEVAPDDAIERRNLAKNWFSRAETAESSGDDLGAIKAYDCSLKLAPHAATAYNLARVSEKAGDLDMALHAYRNYLTLKPQAPDREAVEKSIKDLQARVAALRSSGLSSDQAAANADAARAAETQSTTTAVVDAAPAPTPEAPPLLGTPEWIVAGAGFAALTAGIVFNVAARNKMNECRELAASNRTSLAQRSCDAAPGYAHASYALLGISAAAAIVDLVLILRKPSPRERVSVSLLPNGTGLSATLRF